MSRSAVGGRKSRAAAGEDRLARARVLLDAEGLSVSVSLAGREGEIVVVGGDPSLRRRLGELAPALRELGFRYVALELEPGE